MKRPPQNNAGGIGSTKATEAPAPQPPYEAAARWAKGDKHLEQPAPPPVWTRYIDSRLKQFCSR